MSDRARFLIGSVMIAVALGLIVGGFVLPRPAYSQQSSAEGRSGRYALVTGIEGSTRNTTQVVYLIDNTNRIMYAFEYSSSRKELRPRMPIDIQAVSDVYIKTRAKRDAGKK